MIRLARDHDLPYLQDIERAAGGPFRELGMDAIADDEPPSVAELAAFARDNRAWVSTDGSDLPVGYLLIEIVDGEAHIEQVSVHPDHARRRIGQSLIEVAADWGHRQGLAALTLTTFAEVPWNAPYYERLGFRAVPDADLGDGLRAVRQVEAARGLDRWPRVTMRRDFRPSNSESANRQEPL